jgi:hypothetical protein
MEVEMPVRKFESNVVDLDGQFLEEKLIQEWKHPQEDAAEPIIVENKRESHEHPTHLYVIWDAWAEIDPFERSVTIMRAYEATHPADDILYVTAAEGLTFREADQRKIRYE